MLPFCCHRLSHWFRSCRRKSGGSGCLAAQILGLILIDLVCCSASSAQPPDESLIFHQDLELPEIVRYRSLPQRMFFDPDLEPPQPIRYIPEDLIEFLGRMVQGPYDSSVHIDAVRSLQHIYDEDLGDVTPILPAVRNLLVTTKKHDVRRACAVFLCRVNDEQAFADVARLCLPDNETLCRKVEVLMRNSPPDELVQTWRHRISHPGEYSSGLLALACQGLGTQLHSDSIPELTSLLNDTLNQQSVRMAAAESIGKIDPAHAGMTASVYVDGSVADQLLATRLLTSASNPDSIAMLRQMCLTESGAVASAAWEILARQAPQTLFPLLESGHKHTESGIRFTTIEVMQRYPESSRCVWLNDLMSDNHIGVRNAARRSLLGLCNSHSELRQEILQRAGETLSDSQSNWQQLEQCLVLLAENRCEEYHTAAVDLLQHDQPEVFVSAAWLLHLMPQNDLSKTVAAIAIDRMASTSDGNADHAHLLAMNLQAAFLLQMCGLTREPDIMPLAEAQFQKEIGLTEERRDAGIWAIGFLKEDSNDPSFVDRLFERALDGDLLNPEYLSVQQLSIVSIGRIGAQENYDRLMKIYNQESPGSAMSEAVRHALEPLGRDTFATPEIPMKSEGPWSVFPAN